MGRVSQFTEIMNDMKLEDEFKRKQDQNYNRSLRDARIERRKKDKAFRKKCREKGKSILRKAKLCKAKHGKHPNTTYFHTLYNIRCKDCGVIFRDMPFRPYRSAESIGRIYLKEGNHD